MGKGGADPLTAYYRHFTPLKAGKMKSKVFNWIFRIMFAITLCVASTAAAGPISRNNPYRSFNVHGVNYASVQWEKKHRAPPQIRQPYRAQVRMNRWRR